MRVGAPPLFLQVIYGLTPAETCAVIRCTSRVIIFHLSKNLNGAFITGLVAERASLFREMSRDYAFNKLSADVIPIHDGVKTFQYLRTENVRTI